MRLTIVAFLLFLSNTLFATSDPLPVKLDAFPAAIHLTTQRDRKAIVIQATYSDGLTRDVTAQAALTLADPALAEIKDGSISPRKDGATQLNIAFAGKSLAVPVNVKNAATDRAISFRNDVLPVLTGSGCNTGSCHGTSRGKDGFHLSLFGYNPDGDYFALTRQQPGRRINLAQLHESLVLTKGAGQVQHTGGERFKADSAAYGTITRWLQAGAPADPADLPRVTGLRVTPTQLVLDAPGGKHRISVIAVYSDGSERDVTGTATLLSNNDPVAVIDRATGAVIAHERGEAFVFARYDAFTVGAQVIVVPAAGAAGAEFTWPNPPRHNYVDELVDAKLIRMRIAPSPICPDEQFIRRVTLDITGRVPTRAEFDTFISDPSPNKREKLVDALLTRKEFVEIWVMKFAELLQIRSEAEGKGISYKAAILYYNWLQDQIASNVPMNRIVRDLLSANGGTFSSPATNFYQVESETLKLTENVAQVFMGARIQCAQCHNHPFDRWTMDDYYGFAAFFTQIGRKATEDPRETVIFNSGGGEAKHPIGGREMKPKFLGGETPDLKGRDRRAVAAEWLVSPENPYFARNLANLVWAHFFGKGIVNPVDDARVTNPPSNPELLDALAKKFIEYNYDFRRLVRDICLSRTYQLTNVANPTNQSDERNFSRSYLRRIRSEVLFDVISQVTETSGGNKFKGLPAGARAVQIADGRTSTYFLTTFGRASRDTVCSCEVKMEPNLSQALHLINGDTVQQKMRDGKLVQSLRDKGMTPTQVVEDLYIRCLARKPTPEEITQIDARLKDQADPAPVLEDVFWALLNAKEFVFNH